MVVRSQPRTVSRFLSSDGTSSGTKNLRGNYSGGATDFWIEPPANKWMLVGRIIVSIEDAGQPAAGFYGTNITLTNGITVLQTYANGDADNDFTDSVPIITNAQWGRFSYDVTPQSFGTGNNYVMVRWSFNKFTGLRLRSRGLNYMYPGVLLEPGDKLIVRLHDDFSGLVSHYFMAQGEQWDTGVDW